MATTITNQARLQFTYGATTAIASSNIASAVMQGPLTVEKGTLETAYQLDGELTYIVNLTNGGTSALTNISVRDNLGTYVLSPTLSVTPLYYDDPTQLYINGIFNATLTPTPIVNGIEFTIPSIPAGANAMLIYKADVNSQALLTVGSEIENTITVTAPGLSEPVTATHTIPVAAYADIHITKTMSPNPITGGGTLTNTFSIQNYGNTAATNVILTDTFSPALSAITVSVNGTVLTNADYNYLGGDFTLPGAASSYTLTIPAADFTQNVTTGEVSVNPCTVTIVVSGTV